MQKFEYNIDGKTFIQKPLTPSETVELLGIITDIDFDFAGMANGQVEPEQLGAVIPKICAAIGKSGKINQVLSLIVKGPGFDPDKVSMLTQWEIANDFFVCNEVLALLPNVLITLQVALPRLVEALRPAIAKAQATLQPQ